MSGVVDKLFALGVIAVGGVIWYEWPEIKKFLDDPLKWVEDKTKKAVEDTANNAEEIWEKYTPLGILYNWAKDKWGKGETGMKVK